MDDKKMTGDDMEIVISDKSGKKVFVDAHNEVHEIKGHECRFEGNHGEGLDVNDTCTICGKTLGDVIIERRIPIIVSLEDKSNE